MLWALLLAACPGSAIDDRNGLALGETTSFDVGDAGLVLRADAGAGSPTRAPAVTGRFTSRVFDLGSRATPVQLDLATLAPAGAALPVDGGADAPFALGGFSMQRNALLVPFAEPPGVNVVVDRSGNGFLGRVDGGVSFGAPGLVGQAARFDGGCLVFDSSPAFDPGPTLSVALWIRPRNLNGVDPHGLVSRRLDFQAESQFTFFLWLNDRLWVDLETENDRFQGTRSIANDVWTHVALVYDGRLDAGVRARVYVDGELDAVAPETSASLPPRTIPVVLGCLPNPAGGLSQSYEGEMDEVALFTRALSADEVSALHARGASQHRVGLRTCDTFSCTDAGAFLPVRPGTLVGVPETRFFQYQLEADAPARALEWATVQGVRVDVECPRSPDAGLVDGGTADAGAGGEDAGRLPAVVDGGLDGGAVVDDRPDGGTPGPPSEERRLAVGSGCSSSGTPGGWGLVALALVTVRAGRRQTRRTP
ncbi:MAG: LamG domain-containing protein [Myxococcaceae bacterium]|nr:LamG domain-containing protein [Myxococcaceae bacterium]